MILIAREGFHDEVEQFDDGKTIKLFEDWDQIRGKNDHFGIYWWRHPMDQNFHCGGLIPRRPRVDGAAFAKRYKPRAPRWSGVTTQECVPNVTIRSSLIWYHDRQKYKSVWNSDWYSQRKDRGLQNILRLRRKNWAISSLLFLRFQKTENNNTITPTLIKSLFKVFQTMSIPDYNKLVDVWEKNPASHSALIIKNSKGKPSDSTWRWRPNIIGMGLAHTMVTKLSLKLLEVDIGPHLCTMLSVISPKYLIHHLGMSILSVKEHSNITANVWATGILQRKDIGIPLITQMSILVNM